MTTLATWWIRASICTVGCTLGLFIGLSSSPVVGTFITGIFGVLGGIVLAPFLPKVEESGPKAATPSEHSEIAKSRLSETAIVELMKATVLFCVMCLLGTALGSEIRRGSMSAGIAAMLYPQEKLTDLLEDKPDAVNALYLLNVQRKLRLVGTDNHVNNYVVSKTKDLLEKQKFSIKDLGIVGHQGEQIDDRVMLMILLNDMVRGVGADKIEAKKEPVVLENPDKRNRGQEPTDGRI